eukprot:161125-Rhodomonas_salina.1
MNPRRDRCAGHGVDVRVDAFVTLCKSLARRGGTNPNPGGPWGAGTRQGGLPTADHAAGDPFANSVNDRAPALPPSFRVAPYATPVPHSA